MRRILCAAAAILSTWAPAAAQKATDTGLPADIKAVSVAVDRKGRYHTVFVHRKNVYYAHSRNEGQSWELGPIQASWDDQTMDGPQYGPRIALGPKGNIYVVWTRYRDGGNIWFACSTDGGQSFGRHRKVVDTDSADTTAQMLCSIACTPKDGQIIVAWVDRREGAKEGKQGKPQVYFVTSGDGGMSFPSKNSRANTRMPGAASPDCQVETATLTGEAFLIGFRAHIRGVRDIYLMRSDNGTTFTPRRVSRDGWKLNGCPADAPRIGVARGDANRVVVTWMTAAKDEPQILFAISKNGGKSFGSPRSVGGPKGGNEKAKYDDWTTFRTNKYMKFPSIAVHKDGTFAIAWQDRRGAWWATFSKAGKQKAVAKTAVTGWYPQLTVDRKGRFRLFVLREGKGLFRVSLPGG